MLSLFMVLDQVDDTKSVRAFKLIGYLAVSVKRRLQTADRG